MDWMGSLKHSHTRAPLCGAKNSVVVGDTGKAKHVVTDMIFVKSFTENLESRSREDAKLRRGFQKIWRAEDPKIRRSEAAERVS